MSSKHVSHVRISDKEFFYTSKRKNTKSEAESHNKFSLFTIKFVKNGTNSDEICKIRSVEPKHCFELITDDR